MPINLVVQRPTERPKAMLTRVRVPGAARDFFPTVNFQIRPTLALTASAHSTHLQSHASTYVHTLKISQH